jgi:hypothetical protein
LHLDTLGITQTLARSQCLPVSWMPLTGVMNWTAQNGRTWSNRVRGWKKVSQALWTLWQAMHHKWKWPPITKNSIPNHSYTGKSHKNSVWYLTSKLYDVWIFSQLLLRCVNFWTATFKMYKYSDS